MIYVQKTQTSSSFHSQATLKDSHSNIPEIKDGSHIHWVYSYSQIMAIPVVRFLQVDYFTYVL